MVVTRKTSIPMPPASRTTSTLATPKVNKGKMPQSSLAQEAEDTLLNGAPSPERRYAAPQFSDDALFSDGSPPRKISKDKMKPKSKKKEGKTLAKRRKRPSGWLDLFSRMFILSFLIYSLSVCPTADKQTSPVCRALSEYRRLILEPYVIAPFQNLLHHPSIAPYAAPVIEKAQPVIARSKEEWKTRIVPQWNTRVVPQWNNRVVPQWNKHVVPQWNAHVAPQLAQLDEKVDPYRQQVIGVYNKHAAPYVLQAQTVARKSQPYIILGAAKTYDAYQTSKPYLARLYKELQKVPPLVVKYVIKPLAVYRRQFVDPHVALLLERIKELSSGTAKVPNVPHDQSTVTPAPSVTPKISKEVEGKVGTVEVELPEVPEPTGSNEPLASGASVVSASLALTTDNKTETSEAQASASPEPTAESGTLASAASMISASLVLGNEATETVPGATYSPQAESNPKVLLNDAIESVAESKVEPNVYFTKDGNVVKTVLTQGTVVETLKASATGTPAAENAELASSSAVDLASEPAKEVGSSVSSVVAPSSAVDDELEELLAELELDVEETTTTDAVAEPTVVEETEEQIAARKAQRKAENAEKRRKLEARHSKWEEKLATTIREQTKALKHAIASIRRTGAAELKINLAIRAAIETLNSEAEKALRGTDAYFTKLKAGGKPLAEQARLWDRVLEKVTAKFEERVANVEETVNKWYQEEVLSKEAEEIEKASNTVMTVADEAQADIGLEYAWLDDVTYMDWRRYHALLDNHKAFRDESIALTNGTHDHPYPNAVLDAFEDLQAEVHDITVGFETRMRRIKREGDRAFAVDGQSEEEQTAPEVSILPVADGGKKEDKAFQEVADAILGRSGEEVVDAMGRAEEQVVRHEEL